MTKPSQYYYHIRSPMILVVNPLNRNNTNATLISQNDDLGASFSRRKAAITIYYSMLGYTTRLLERKLQLRYSIYFRRYLCSGKKA